MTRKMMRKTGPLIMSNPPLFDGLFRAAMQSLSFAEHKTFKSAALMLQITLESSQHHAAARQVAATHGLALTDIVLRGAGGDVDRSNLGTLMECTLWKLHVAAPAQLKAWVVQLLQQPGYPTAGTSDAAKQTFIIGLGVMRTHDSRQGKELFNNFASACRGLVHIK
jgi:hypothetical protein